MPEGIKPPKGPEAVDVSILERTARAQQEVAEGKLVINFYDKDGGVIHSIPWSPANNAYAERSYAPAEVEPEVADASDSTEVEPSPASSEALPAAHGSDDFEKMKEELSRRVSGSPHLTTEARTEYMERVLASTSMDDIDDMTKRMDLAEKVVAPTPPKAPSEPPVKKVSLSLGGSAPAGATSPDRAKTDRKTDTAKEAPKAPPPPPLEYTESDRTEGLAKSPFTMRTLSLSGIPLAEKSPDGDLPKFISDSLPPLSRPEKVVKPLKLAEILSVPRNDELFTICVTSLAGERVAKDLAEKYEKSKLDPSAMTEADHQMLLRFQDEFNERFAYLSEVREYTRESDVDFMLKNDPAFAFLRDKLPAARATEIIKIHMDKVFMGLPRGHIERIVGASRNNRDIRRSDYFREMYEFVQIKAEAFYKKFPDGKPPTMFSIRGKTPEERAKMFEFLTPTFMERWNSKTGYTTERLYSNNNLNVENSVRTLDAIDANRIEIMQIFAATISQDTDLKREVAREVLTGSLVRPVGADVPTRNEAVAQLVKGDGQIADTDTLRRRIRDEGFRREVGKLAGTEWEDMDTEERERFSYQQLQEEGKLPTLRRGLFSMWLGSIFDIAFPDMQRKLANEFE